MKSSFGMSVLRVFLAILGVVFLVLAAALFFVSVMMFSAYGRYEDIRQARYAFLPTTAVFGLGVLLFVVGLVAAFSCCCYDRKCLPSTLATFLFILVAMEMAACGLCYRYKVELEAGARKELITAFRTYGNSSDLFDEINFIQVKGRCCGIDNYTDWIGTSWYRAVHRADPSSTQIVPGSCCKNPYQCSGSSNYPQEFNQEGCYQRFLHIFSDNLVYIIEVGIAFFVIQVLGLIFSLIMVCQKQEAPHSYRVLAHDLDYTI